ncbi:hypothetical protein M0804_007881 [Polistes exclamans]|nr:hypothetical protein M0804_007881 [Polistes exclamans]
MHHPVFETLPSSTQTPLKMTTLVSVIKNLRVNELVHCVVVGYSRLTKAKNTKEAGESQSVVMMVVIVVVIVVVVVVVDDYGMTEHSP